MIRTREELGSLPIEAWTDAELEHGESEGWWRNVVAWEIERRRTGERDIREEPELQRLLVGRTILAVERDSDGEWVTLRLDNGTLMRFTGWGHDAWGCDATFVERPDA